MQPCSDGRRPAGDAVAVLATAEATERCQISDCLPYVVRAGEGLAARGDFPPAAGELGASDRIGGALQRGGEDLSRQRRQFEARLPSVARD